MWMKAPSWCWLVNRLISCSPPLVPLSLLKYGVDFPPLILDESGESGSRCTAVGQVSPECLTVRASSRSVQMGLTVLTLRLLWCESFQVGRWLRKPYGFQSGADSWFSF